jgi:hypothetical protein
MGVKVKKSYYSKQQIHDDKNDDNKCPSIQLHMQWVKSRLQKVQKM